MSLLERACAPKTAAVLSRHRVCIGGKEGENLLIEDKTKEQQPASPVNRNAARGCAPFGHSCNAWGFCTGTGCAVKPRIM